MSRRKQRRGRTLSAPLTAVLLLPALVLAGCKGEAPTLHEVRSAIQRQLPGARLEPEVTFSLGRFSLGLVKGLVRLTDGGDEDGKETAQILSHLRRIEIGVYEVQTANDEGFHLELPASLEQELKNRGWEVLLRAREDGEQTWIFFESEGEAIRSIYIVALDETELSLIHLQGRLDRLIADAIADNPDAATNLFLGEGKSASVEEEEGAEPVDTAEDEDGGERPTG